MQLADDLGCVVVIETSRQKDLLLTTYERDIRVVTHLHEILQQLVYQFVQQTPTTQMQI